ncbi:AFG1/ZapE family ATPase, partial [Pseudomonas aeruginosa]|uniref:AFG1/ZapE family ATPase n=1 Tax=Pseudomonas aeruginosa TaxID=287 RepID=UPI003221B68D
GFNRERFLPAIEAIQRHMVVVAVDGGQDHRLHPGRAEQRYWVVEAGHAGGFAGPVPGPGGGAEGSGRAPRRGAPP